MAIPLAPLATGTLDAVVVVLALVAALAYLLRRAIRTFGSRSGTACGCAGTPSCPVAVASKDLRRLARRAVAKLPRTP